MAADTSCRRRNQRSTRAGVFFRTIHAVRTIIVEPSVIPMSGDSTMNATILMIPEAMRPETPSAGSVAPIMPPASAWEEEDGSPHHQVSRFQTIAPMSAAKMTVSTSGVPCARSMPNSTMPLPIVAATFSSTPHRTGAAEMKLKKAAHATAHERREHARRHDRRDRVRRVVEAVDEVEGEGDEDEPDDDGEEHGGLGVRDGAAARRVGFATRAPARRPR